MRCLSGAMFVPGNPLHLGHSCWDQELTSDPALNEPEPIGFSVSWGVWNRGSETVSEDGSWTEMSGGIRAGVSSWVNQRHCDTSAGAAEKPPLHLEGGSLEDAEEWGRRWGEEKSVIPSKVR